MSRAMTLSGTLPLPPASEPLAEPDPEPEVEPLIAAVLEVRAARGDMDVVMQLFRSATIWVETESSQDGQARTVRSVHTQGLSWLPVFSALEHLARFSQATGRGDQEVQYGQLTGAEAIDEIIPVLPPGTGMVLDPVADHVLALPAVTGIVPDHLAVDGAGVGERRGGSTGG